MEHPVQVLSYLSRYGRRRRAGPACASGRRRLDASRRRARAQPEVRISYASYPQSLRMGRIGESTWTHRRVRGSSRPRLAYPESPMKVLAKPRAAKTARPSSALFLNGGDRSIPEKIADGIRSMDFDFKTAIQQFKKRKAERAILPPRSSRCSACQNRSETVLCTPCEVLVRHRLIDRNGKLLGKRK